MTPTMTKLLLLAGVATGLTGCWSGTLGIAAAISSAGGGGGNAAPVLELVSLTSTRTSPAILELELTDAESNTASLALRFRLQGDPTSAAQPLTLVIDPARFPEIDDNLNTLESSPQGTRIRKLWDYESDLGNNDVTEVSLFAEIIAADGNDDQAINPDPLVAQVGNATPEVTVEGISSGMAAGGIVPIFLCITDPQLDDLQVNIDYRIVGAGGPCGDYGSLARSAEIRDDEEVSEPFSIDTSANDPLSDDPEVEVFFWNTAFGRSDPIPGCELAPGTFTVDVRVTAIEVLDSEFDEPLTSIVEVLGIVIDNS